MKLHVAMALALVSCVAFAQRSKKAVARDFGMEFDKEESWRQGHADFNVEHGRNGFRFTDKDQSCANCADPGAVLFHGLPVMETRVHFAADGVARVEFSLYNKGDAERLGRGELTKAAFDELLGRVREILSDGAKAPEIQKVDLRASANVVQRRQVWTKRKPAAELGWGYVQDRKARTFRAEFVRVTLMPKLVRSVVSAARTGGAKSANSVKKNVRTNEKGDVWIDGVPMTDQGSKGYCAAATSERVLRYFGTSVDEHDIAQIAGTTAGGGTSQAAMAEAVARIGDKYGLRKEDLVGGARGGGTWEKSEFYKMLQAYNSAAKKMRRPVIDWHAYEQNHVIDVGGMMAAMDPKVLKEGKVKQTGAYKCFRDGVRKFVKAGVPLFWGVTLGIYPEPEIPQANGGHMRLIIGYNDKRREILYTDSWGVGHELKRMPEDWAWTVTTCLLALTPVR